MIQTASLRRLSSGLLDRPIAWSRGKETARTNLPQPAAQRILIVLHDFSGGGTERVAIRLANQWVRRGRTVRLFCGDARGPLRDLVDPAVEVVQAKPALPRGPLSRLRLGLALAGDAARFRPDAVFSPGNFHLPVLAAFALRDRSRATTFCKISNPLLRQDRHGIGQSLRKLALRTLAASVDVMVAMSPGLRDESAAMLGPARIATRWEPILTRSRTDLSQDRAPGLVVAIGRLEPQKNFALAIEAMARLSPDSNARLVILGEGQERVRLTRLIRALGLEQRVSLPGHVANPDAWLRRASCFLMTSHYEGYPAALVEALASATPVLVTPCSSALPEILGIQTATALVDPTPEAIARALQECLGDARPFRPDPLLIARHDEDRAALAYLGLMDQRRAITLQRQR